MLVPMSKIEYGLEPFTKADIKGDEELLGGRWGSFWDPGEEVAIVKCSQWWVRELRQLVRKFARTHPGIPDAEKAYRVIRNMPGDPVFKLYDKMATKWPRHAWSDTDVIDGHLSNDLEAALEEIYG